MAEISLAIDFGNSYTSIYKKHVGLVLKEPSLIACQNSEEDYVLKSLGQEAKAILGKTDERTVVFSPLSGGYIKSLDYAIVLLKHFIFKAIGKKKLFTKLKILATYPTGLPEEEITNYKKLFKACGASNVILIPKAIASAYGCNININSNNARLVLDIGGGTIDAAVINLNTVVEGATLSVGSKSLDNAIIEVIEDRYGTTIGIATAERIKEEIGSMFKNDTACVEVVGINLQTKGLQNIVVNAGDIYQSIALFVSEIVKLVPATINQLNPEINADIARNGIIVCGGFSKIAGLEKFLRNSLKLPVTICDSSENATIFGAGKLLMHTNVLDNIIAEL